MIAEVESLIRAVNDDGVFGEAAGFEFVENNSNAFVHGANGAQVVFEVALVLPLENFFVGEFAGFHLSDEFFIFRRVCGVPCFFLLFGHALVFSVGKSFGKVLGKEVFSVKFHVVPPIHVLCDAHCLVMEGFAPIGVVVEEGVRFWEIDIIEKSEVAFGRSPIAVRRFVLSHDHEGLFGVFCFFDFVESDCGDDIVAMAGIAFGGAIHLLEVRVVVVPLAWQDFPMMKTDGIGSEVPFADHGGAVAGFL